MRPVPPWAQRHWTGGACCSSPARVLLRARAFQTRVRARRRAACHPCRHTVPDLHGSAGGLRDFAVARKREAFRTTGAWNWGCGSSPRSAMCGPVRSRGSPAATPLFCGSLGCSVRSATGASPRSRVRQAVCEVLLASCRPPEAFSARLRLAGCRNRVCHGIFSTCRGVLGLSPVLSQGLSGTCGSSVFTEIRR